MTRGERGIPSYPPPYKVIDGCLYREVRTKNGSYDQKLCNFLPTIISEISIDDGAEENRRLRLGGVRQDGTPLPEIEIAGGELGGFNWLIEQWGADCILEVGPSVRDRLRYAIQQTAHEAERQTVYAVTGWKRIDGEWRFLMPGDEAHTVQLPDKLSRYSSAAEEAPEALSVLARLLEYPPAPREIIWPLLAYTFLSPLNHFLHMVDCEPKFVFLLLGRTGAGKSTLAALFLSFFGHFTASDLPLSFRDTPNSIIHNAFALKDVLTCIDDFHPCGRQEEQKLTATAQSVIRAYGDRVGRGRLRADSSFMAARQPQGNAIITAEYPPDVGESGTARCFTAELKPGDVNLKELSFFQTKATKGTLQSCMLGYIRWLREKYLTGEQTEETFLSTLHKAFTDRRNEFRGSGIRCHGRLPEIVAWLELGMETLLGFLKERKVITADRAEEIREDFSSLLRDMARRQARSIDLDRPALIFVRKLFALIESGQVCLLKKDELPEFMPRDFIGYEDDSFYYLLNDAAHRAVRKFCDEQGELFTVSSRALPKALAEEGLTEITDGENTRSVRFRNGTRRVVCLYRERARQMIEGGMR